MTRREKQAPLSDEEINLLDALSHEAALDEMERGEPTPEDRAKSEAAVARVRERLAELGADADAVEQLNANGALGVSLLGIDRAALLARFADLENGPPGDVAELSDDELRALLVNAAR